MGKRIFEEGPAPRPQAAPAPAAGGAALDKVKKQARQLAYDVRYKVKSKFGEGQKTDPASLARAYAQELQKSPAPASVKAIAKQMLSMREEYDIDELVSESVASALKKVFVENSTVLTEEGQVFKVYVYDPKTKTTYRRRANREKISQLRAKGLRVEITKYGTEYEGEKKRGEKTAEVLGGGDKKAKKDYDGDGKIESPAKEHAGAVHNAIQRQRGLKPDGKDTSSVKEELSGNQYKIDANHNNKIDSNDFKILRSKKKRSVKEGAEYTGKGNKKGVHTDSSVIDKEITGDKVNNKKFINLKPTLSNVQAMEQTLVNPNIPVAQKPTQQPVTKPSAPSPTQKSIVAAQKKALAAKKTQIQADLTQLSKGEPLSQMEDYDMVSEMSVSKAQHGAAGAAYRAKKTGNPEGLRGASLQMYNSMSLKQLRDFAKTKESSLPSKVAEESEIEECDMPETKSKVDSKKVDKRSTETTMSLIKTALRARGMRI